LLLSSSEALLPPPCLLLMLRRLELRLGRIMALMGLGTPPLGGDAGGDTVAAIALAATAAPLSAVGVVRAVGCRGVVENPRAGDQLSGCSRQRINWALVVTCIRRGTVPRSAGESVRV
jgi:hypothetical protein